MVRKRTREGVLKQPLPRTDARSAGHNVPRRQVHFEPAAGPVQRGPAAGIAAGPSRGSTRVPAGHTVDTDRVPDAGAGSSKAQIASPGDLHARDGAPRVKSWSFVRR